MKIFERCQRFGKITLTQKKKQYGSGGNSNTNPGGYTGGSGGYDRSFSSRFGNCYQLKLFTFLINLSFRWSLQILEVQVVLNIAKNMSIHTAQIMAEGAHHIGIAKIIIASIKSKKRRALPTILEHSSSKNLQWIYKRIRNSCKNTTPRSIKSYLSARICIIISETKSKKL